MKEIIGVDHDGKEIRQAVISYIDAYYPNLESIMLELPPEMNRISFPFFSPIAQHYQSKGIRVIAGDINRWKVLGLTLEENLALNQMEPREKSKRIKIMRDKGLRDVRKGHVRDAGIEEVCKEEEPELTVVGAHHAKYLKAKYPEIPFTYFGPRSLREILMYRNIAKAADKVFRIKPEYDPERKESYKEDLIAGLIHGAFMFGGLGFLAADPFYILKGVLITQVACSGLGVLSNAKGAYYYLRTVTEKRQGEENDTKHRIVRY